MQKILLTGASGFLGNYIIDGLKNKYEIIGLCNKQQQEKLQNNFFIDLANVEQLEEIFKKVQPDIVIHTAAISSIIQCEKDVDYAYQVNVIASTQLATLCNINNIKFIFCSTDMVFDGKKGNYTETDIPNPINIYGTQKYEAEIGILQANENAILARLPLMIGENKNGNAGVVAEMQEKNETAAAIHLFTNEFRTPALVEEVVQGLKILIKNNCVGIYHVSGSQKLNRLQIAEYIKEKYNLSNLKLIPTTHQAIGITNRPQDISMDNKKMIALGYNPLPILVV
jgi:dTDP-4-dehydrorhamnose reductase